MSFLHRLVKADKHLLCLYAIVVLINVPYLSPRMIYTHDTFNNFIFFHFAYGELFFHNEFPRWIPYMGYGMPFDFALLGSISPSDYVMMILGWLLGIKDALLLSKLSYILSQAVFAAGLYLLGCKLFSSKLAVWMVCLASLLTNSWLYQSLWNFAIFYMLPLVLYFLLEFIDHGRARDLWLAATLETLSLLGNLTYIAPIHLLILATFVLPFFWRQPDVFRQFLRPRNFAHPLFFVFVLLLALIGNLAFGMETQFLSHDRDLRTGSVSLQTFLTDSRQTPAALAIGFLKGPVYFGEITLYIGLFPLAGACYALVRRRDRRFLAFAAVAFVLISG